MAIKYKFNPLTGKFDMVEVYDLSGYVLLDQSTPQTIGSLTDRLAKLWSSDIATTAISADNSYNINTVEDPATACTAVVSAGGSVNTGVHGYYVTYTTAIGETYHKRVSVTTTAGNNTVTLTVPTSPDARVTGRKLYRSKAGNIYNEYYLATISDNTTTTYVDTAADSTLTTQYRGADYRANTTSNYITVAGVKAMTIDNNAVYLGTNAGQYVTSGGYNTFIGTNAGRYATTALSNTFVGYLAGSLNSTGDNTTGVGTTVMYGNVSGTGSTGMGVSAGRYYGATGSNQLTTTTNSVFIGLTTRSGSTTTSTTNEIVIGALAVGLGNNSVVLGNDSITTTVLKGSVGINVTSPTAKLHLPAGTNRASSAPLKFTSGVLNTTPEEGAVEFTGNDLYLVINSGTNRKEFILNDGSKLTSGKIPVATTNGRLTNVTPQTELTDELTTITFTAPGTPDYALQDLTDTGGFGFATKDEGNTVLSVIANLQTRINELETKLVALGLLADAD